MSIFIQSLTPYLGLIIMYTLMSQILPCRRSMWSIFLYSTLILINGVGKAVLGSDGTIGQLLGLVAPVTVCIILPLILFTGPKWKRILIAVFFLAIQLGSDLITYLIFASIFLVDPRTLPVVQLTFYSFISLSTFAMFGTLFLLLLRSVTMRKFQWFYLVFLVFPIGQVLLCSCYLYPNYTSTLWMIGTVFSLIADIALLYHTFSSEKKSALEQELQAVRYTISLEHQHYAAMEENREKLAKIRHDFNNQLAVVEQLFRNGEDENARSMIRAIANDIKESRDAAYCHIPVVNAAIAEKSQAGVPMDVELLIPTTLSVEPLHLCSIFTNLLDNAIEGTKASGKEDGRIKLTASIEGDYLYIKTVNPAISPKTRSTPGRGYGQRILKDLATRYHGAYWTKFENETYTAIVTIQL